MNAFSQDSDLVKFEPGVFGAWYRPSQVLCGGTNGIIAGTQFTAAGVNFVAAQVQPGGAIWLQSADGAITGAFEIVAVVDSGHLTVSVIRANDQQAVIPVGSASGLTWRIVTYAPQAYEVLWQISQRLGLSPGYAGADYAVEDIVNAAALRQASVFGVLAMVFGSLYQGMDGQEALKDKHEIYRLRFAEAMARLRLRLDTDGDGDAERTARTDVMGLVRK